MTPPKSAGDHVANVLLAAEMIGTGSPEWLALYRQVREYLALEGRAKAGNLPRRNRAAAEARRHLAYVLDLLHQEEREAAEPPPVFKL